MPPGRVWSPGRSEGGKRPVGHMVRRDVHRSQLGSVAQLAERPHPGPQKGCEGRSQVQVLPDPRNTEWQ